MITLYQTHSHSANAIILTSSVKAELINTHGRGTAEISWLLFLQIKREFEGHGRGVGKSSTSDVYLVILPTSWWATRGDSNNIVSWYIWSVHTLWRQSFNWLRMQRLGSAGINGVERIFTTTIYYSIAVWHFDAFERGLESVQIFCSDLMANTVNMETNHHNMKQKQHSHWNVTSGWQVELVGWSELDSFGKGDRQQTASAVTNPIRHLAVYLQVL